MGGVNKVQLESFAAGIAAGRTVKDAALAAGYAPGSSSPYKVCRRVDFKARVEALTRERTLAGPDLTPVILALMDGAAHALTMPTAAAQNAAARMLAEAGRLKQKLPKARRGRLSPNPDDDLSLEDWAALYGPDS